jgi:hypothetical protein
MFWWMIGFYLPIPIIDMYLAWICWMLVSQIYWCVLSGRALGLRWYDPKCWAKYLLLILVALPAPKKFDPSPVFHSPTPRGRYREAFKMFWQNHTDINLTDQTRPIETDNKFMKGKICFTSSDHNTLANRKAMSDYRSFRCAVHFVRMGSWAGALVFWSGLYLGNMTNNYLYSQIAPLLALIFGGIVYNWRVPKESLPLIHQQRRTG